MATYGLQIFAKGGVVIFDTSNIGLGWRVGQGSTVNISYGSEPNSYSQVEYLIHSTPAVTGLPARYYERNARTIENDVFLSLHPNEKNHPNHWDNPPGIDFWLFSLDVTYSGPHITKAVVNKGSLTAVGLNNNRR